MLIFNKLLCNPCITLTSQWPKLMMSRSNNYCTGQPHSWRKVWQEREGEWSSKFNLFAPEGKGNSPDLIRFLQTDIDLRPSTIYKWLLRRKEKKKIIDQSYILERHSTLGCDLAAAHFLVHRGGAIRFHESPHWLRKDEDDNYNLPSKFVPNVLIDAIDASDMELRYEGLANMVRLKKLQWLSLRGCKFMDDWCMDKISGEYSDSLKFLDISNCPNVTYRGVQALHRLRKLKELRLDDGKDSYNLQMTCLMLEDLNPSLNIIGVSHMQNKPDT